MLTKRNYLLITILAIAISSSMILGACKKSDSDASKSASGKAGSADSGAAAATVNGEKILMSDLDAIMSMSMGGSASHGGQDMPEIDDATKKEMRAKMLGQMIDGEILYQESLKFAVADLDKKVQEQYADILKRYKTEEEFIKEIEENNLTVDKVLLNLKKNISIKNYIDNEVMASIEVSEDDMKKFYDENKDRFNEQSSVKASHILVKVEKNSTDAQKKEAYNKILAIKNRVDGGEDFAEVAKEASEGPSGPQGGDLGFFGKGMMVKEFEDVAFKTEVGKVSDIVETQFGFHIIKVTDAKKAETKTFEDVKEGIKEELKRESFQSTMTKLLEELKAKSKVDILL